MAPPIQRGEAWRALPHMEPLHATSPRGRAALHDCRDGASDAHGRLASVIPPTSIGILVAHHRMGNSSCKRIRYGVWPKLVGSSE
jgi:hypothetical protein